VERIVKLSVRNVGHGATDPITTLHRAGEEANGDANGRHERRDPPAERASPFGRFRDE
jgi:hypothetical protein